MQEILSTPADEALASATLPDRAVMFSGVVCVVLTRDRPQHLSACEHQPLAGRRYTRRAVSPKKSARSSAERSPRAACTVDTMVWLSHSRWSMG